MPIISSQTMQELTTIPGIGKSIARDLIDIGIRQVNDLKGKDPQELYEHSNRVAGCTQDKCLLYVFRCAVYYAETPPGKREKQKLNWWYWKNKG